MTGAIPTKSLAYFLPDDMELVVFVNSMVDGQTGATNNFREVVKQTYLNNLTTQPPLHLQKSIFGGPSQSTKS